MKGTPPSQKRWDQIFGKQDRDRSECVQLHVDFDEFEPKYTLTLGASAVTFQMYQYNGLTWPIISDIKKSS